MRDDLRACVIEHLGDRGAVLVADETGDVKKGTATPGVQRQYTGTAGRIENAQVAVYLGYAAPRGHARCSRPHAITGSPGGPGVPCGPMSWRPGCRHLLIRRNRATGELAFYRCYSQHPVTLAALVTVAGLRWTVEENFQAGKGLTGLDEHQARRWTSWYRWVTLAMLAAAFLAITAALERARRPAPASLTPLTRNEIARLLSVTLTRPAGDASHHLPWSYWRRRHQYRSRTCYYQRQSDQDRQT